MDKTLKYWIGTGVIILSVIFIAYFTYDSGSQKHKWSRTLGTKGDEPFDISVFYLSLIKAFESKVEYIPVKSSISEKITSMDPAGSVYFYIGNKYYLSDSDIIHLNNFVYNGGVAFISSSGIPNALLKNSPYLEDAEIQYYYADSAVISVVGTSDSFTFHGINKNKIVPANWYHINYMDTSNDSGVVSTISYIKPYYSDLIAIPHGAGTMYLHVNPVVFANIYQKEEKGREYCKRIIQQLPQRKLWIDQSGSIKKTNAAVEHGAVPITEFLRSNPPLYYAWGILLATVVLFLILGGRRTQRAIPVFNKPVNNTINFVESIGHFYFKEESNLNIYRREWQQLVQFIKHHFHMQFNSLEENVLASLSAKSGVSYETIIAILEMQKHYHIYAEISNKDLIIINRTINTFYNEYRNKYGK